MKSLIILFLSITLTCCARKVSNTYVDQQKIYFKKEFTGFSTCVMEHSECGDISKFCVESPPYLGGTRQCMQDGQIGEFFGCTTGELIILPDEPFRLDCL